MFIVNDISYAYRKAKVLNHVSMEIHGGDCVALVGVNGCGKTTLLSICAGARKAKSGEVKVFGKSLPRGTKERLQHIGYVPQENPLIPDLTVRQNLKLWYAGNSKEFQKELESGFLSALDLSSFLDKRCDALSGGMKKRVSIGLALQNHPAILILDEPGAALDLICKEDIRHFLELYLKAGGTILITTHEEDELALCNRMYTLRKGMIEEVDPKIRGEELLGKIR